ncbi:MAG: hypothetical protein JRI23_28480 [Deltaproteobacteria bacterium]|jgi:hypothetical protein|nr:hypothetical protein [Deltaproteobacteria bacterium]MBW2536037.1 hypothetical protein [Deltaproteobacteria bacterium]
MIVRKVARAVCVLAALSLAGCVVDATGETDEQDRIGEAAWDLTNTDDDVEFVGNGDGEASQGDDGADDEDDAVPVPFDWQTTRAQEVVDPHPDPWKSDGQTESPDGHD